MCLFVLYTNKYQAIKSPINESNEPVSTIEVDYTLEEELKRGNMVDIEDFLNNQRIKYGLK